MKFKHIVFFTLLFTCRLPFVPNEAEPFVPPPIYATWWSRTEQCHHIYKNMNLVDWYVMPGASFIDPTGKISIGYHDHLHITLAGDYMYTEWTVRHEMLHALLFPIDGHPDKYFNKVCEI